MPENTKPTEGPWRIRDEEGAPFHRIWADGRIIVYCIPQQFQRAMGHPTDVILRAYSEAEANARLIVDRVNAPEGRNPMDVKILDLYRAALNRIVRQTTDQDVAVPIAERAFAAAKALREGEKP